MTHLCRSWVFLVPNKNVHIHVNTSHMLEHTFFHTGKGGFTCVFCLLHPWIPSQTLFITLCMPPPPTVLVFRGDLGVLANASQMASVWVEVNNQIFLSLRTQDSKEKNNNAANFRASKALKQSVKCCSVANLPPHPPRLTPGRHHPLPSSPTRHHQDRC